MNRELTPEMVMADLQRHLSDCTAQRVATKEKLDLIDGKLDGFNRSAWKAIGAIGLVLLATFGTLFVQSQANHESNTRVATSAAQTVVQTSSQDRYLVNAKLDQISARLDRLDAAK